MVKSALLPSACFASMVLVAGLDDCFPLDVSHTPHAALKAPPNATVHAAGPNMSPATLRAISRKLQRKPSAKPLAKSLAKTGAAGGLPLSGTFA